MKEYHSTRLPSKIKDHESGSSVFESDDSFVYSNDPLNEETNDQYSKTDEKSNEGLTEQCNEASQSNGHSRQTVNVFINSSSWITSTPLSSILTEEEELLSNLISDLESITYTEKDVNPELSCAQMSEDKYVAITR